MLLLIEVSESSLRAELNEKADIYAEAGVPEYWIVDIPSQRVHMMSEISDGRYRSIEIITPPTKTSPRCYPEAALNTEKLFEVH